jgi:hypothetical protein
VIFHKIEKEKHNSYTQRNKSMKRKTKSIFFKNQIKKKMSCNTKKCKWKNVVVNMEKQIVALLQVKRKCDVKK